MNVVYSQTAQRDRLRHIEWVERFSYRAADRMDSRIEQHVALLRHFPRIGKETEPGGVREFAVQNTDLLIRYRLKHDDILILRILHSAQDWPGRF